MKKVIYMPRSKGAGSFNIELDPSGGSYLDWHVAGINSQGYPTCEPPFVAPYLGFGGGRFNYVNQQISNNNVYYQTTLEVFPVWSRISDIVNSAANGAHFASRKADSFGSAFYNDSANFWGINRQYYPSLDTVPRQNVIACFNSVLCGDGVNTWTEKIAIRVNASHFSTSYGVARDRRFFTTGAFGGGFYNDITVNYWETLRDVLSDTLNNYSNGYTPNVQATEANTGDSRLTFFSVVGSSNRVERNGINYIFQNVGTMNQTLEGAGYDVNQFNNVINV